MKKVLVLTVLLIFALSSLCLAAKSSSRPSSGASHSTPSTSAPASQAAPSSGYKPSAPASSYNDKAPAAKTQATTQAPHQSTGSSWMRNIGMLAGGMMLGSMLSNLFGQGSTGMFADIMGILATLIPIVLLFMLGRFLWIRYKSRQDKDNISRY
jgi:predicted lipid-binding transport protein (Tim44 family)